MGNVIAKIKKGPTKLELLLSLFDSDPSAVNFCAGVSFVGHRRGHQAQRLVYFYMGDDERRAKSYGVYVTAVTRIAPVSGHDQTQKKKRTEQWKIEGIIACDENGHQGLLAGHKCVIAYRISRSRTYGTLKILPRATKK